MRSFAAAVSRAQQQQHVPTVQYCSSSSSSCSSIAAVVAATASKMTAVAAAAAALVSALRTRLALLATRHPEKEKKHSKRFSICWQYKRLLAIKQHSIVYHKHEDTA
jgi:hypothetical protein